MEQKKKKTMRVSVRGFALLLAAAVAASSILTFVITKSSRTGQLTGTMTLDANGWSAYDSNHIYRDESAMLSEIQKMNQEMRSFTAEGFALQGTVLQSPGEAPIDETVAATESIAVEDDVAEAAEAKAEDADAEDADTEETAAEEHSVDIEASDAENTDAEASDEETAKEEKENAVDPDVVNGSTSAADINNYLHSVSVSAQLNIADGKQYANTVNGRTQINQNDSDIQSRILISRKTKIVDDIFNQITSGTTMLPGMGSVNSVYPGSILNVESTAAAGYAPEVVVERGSGHFTYHLGDSTGEFTMDDLSAEAMQDKLYETLKKALGRKTGKAPYEITVAKATSPEQLAAELGISRDDAARFVYNYWEDIYNGKCQVVVACAKQIVLDVSYDDIGENPASLFAPEVTLGRVQALINNDNPAMYVKRAQYGNTYLLSGMLYNDTCWNTQAENGFVDVADLLGGMTNYLKSGQASLTPSQKNALTYARIEMSHIGKDIREWTPMEQTSLPSFIQLINTNAEYTKSDELIPITYEALTLGGRQLPVTLSTAADKYDICAIESVRTGNFWVHEEAQGVATDNEKKQVWGIDITKFNNTNAIAEYRYINENNTSRSRRSEQVPAYQVCFGLYADADADACECDAWSADRIVQFAYYTAECKGKHTNHNGEVTGPTDLAKGIYAHTKDWSRDCYFYVNGIEYGGVNGQDNHGSKVRVTRVWDKNKDGAALALRNNLTLDSEILFEGR